MTQRKLLVTSALPYANGPLHLGHMLEHIQTDIWVRFQKLIGNNCLSVCADDAHGTPIMLKAEQLDISAETLIETVKADHLKDFAAFGIAYDNYHSTHSEENKALLHLIFKRLQANGDIVKRQIRQAFDPEKKMFLPDRYVRGTCPKCGATDQYGDSCEHCGATYSPMALSDPISVISGCKPIEKDSEHYFFDLPKYQPMLEKWVQETPLQPQVVNKLQEWFTQRLIQWDITRDHPYFGFKIPGEEDKYFYVWLDAPIGYMASFKNFCDKNPSISFDAYWGKDSQAELIHFIGKDIMYFHTLFWPAILSGAEFRTPTSVYCHGFLTVNGTKMSKSRGTFILAKTYLDNLPAEFLRYFFAAKLNPNVDDIDLNLSDFKTRVNADLIGKVVNIASRCAGFLKKHFDNCLSEICYDEVLYQDFQQSGNAIYEHYEKRNFASAVREIMKLADKANQFIDHEKPWQLIKIESQKDRVHQVCSLGINLFRLLIIYLKPILPETAKKSEVFLKSQPFTWQDRKTPLLNHKIEDYQPLLMRVEEEQVQNLLKTNPPEATDVRFNRST